MAISHSSQFTAFTNKSAKALTSAHIFVGNGSGESTDVALSGNASIDKYGQAHVTGLKDQSDLRKGTGRGPGNFATRPPIHGLLSS